MTDYREEAEYPEEYEDFSRQEVSGFEHFERIMKFVRYAGAAVVIIFFAVWQWNNITAFISNLWGKLV